jgi:Flp pilus assembly pilin Flp
MEYTLIIAFAALALVSLMMTANAHGFLAGF